MGEDKNKMENKKTIMFVGVGLVIVTLFFLYFDNNELSGFGIPVIVYKSPMCGCCEGYISNLEGNGFDVDVEIVQNMQSIKIQYNIPPDMQSCHTVIIGDYFVEGHVPLEAVNKLLNEKPDIDGIALPGMLSGSPGMPGKKTETFQIYALSNGASSEFMII